MTWIRCMPRRRKTYSACSPTSKSTSLRAMRRSHHQVSLCPTLTCEPPPSSPLLTCNPHGTPPQQMQMTTLRSPRRRGKVRRMSGRVLSVPSTVAPPTLPLLTVPRRSGQCVRLPPRQIQQWTSWKSVVISIRVNVQLWRECTRWERQLERIDCANVHTLTLQLYAPTSDSPPRK